MLESGQNIDIDEASEKSFGIVFAIVFLLIGLYPLTAGEEVWLWSLIVSAILILVAYIAPNMLAVPNRWWFKFGMALGAVVAPLVMLLVHVVTVVPIGLIIKLLGKDLLRIKFDERAKSYWIERDQPVGSMRDQF